MTRHLFRERQEGGAGESSGRDSHAEKSSLGEQASNLHAHEYGRALSDVSNNELLAALKSFAGVERQALAKIIAYLAEVEERRLHLELACSSMFDFCTRRLGLSEGEAFRRLTAARLVRRLPTLLDAIASGRIHLSSVVLLRDVLTEANVDEVVASVTGKTKREVEELVAQMAPKADVKASIRRLPERREAARRGTARTNSKTASDVPSLQLQPLAETRYKVQLTADTALRDKLELARQLMSHRNASGDLAVIVEKAIDLLIEKLSNDKLATTKRPRKAKPSSRRGYITRATRREVFERDGGQCAFVSESGERCPARLFLELDHRTPQALGGTGDADNVRVFCHAHNHDAAERVFGRAYVEARIRDRRRKSSPPPDDKATAAESGCFSQRKFDRADPQVLQVDNRDQLRSALLALGFRSSEADHALVTIDRIESEAPWRRPLEALVREALGILT